MDPNKYFKGEEPPVLSFTFASAVTASEVVARFAPRFDETSVLDLTVTMAGDGLTGTASPTAADLDALSNGVYDCFVLGDGGVLDSDLFTIRTLPTPAEVS